MIGKLRHIGHRKYPGTVKLLIGAPAALVSRRHLRNNYQTNQEIKYWSTWFLLKSLTTTSYIQHWISQREYLLAWLQMNENTFRRHLAWLKSMDLLELDKKNYSIRLCGYQHAAEIMEISYEGIYEVGFDPINKTPGKQTFQYVLRTEEFEHHKNRQASALMYKIDHNPSSLKDDLLYYLLQAGADYHRLQADPAYYADRLLRLQIRFFKEGSELFQYIMSFRADINRGAKLIKKHHQYKSCQSVAYMKRKMLKLGIASIWKVAMESEARMRFYIPAQEDTAPNRIRNGMQEGYKWLKEAKSTMWVLTDQVKRQYPSNLNKPTLILKSTTYAA